VKHLRAFKSLVEKNMGYISVTEFKESVYFNGLEDYWTTNDQISGFLDDVCGIIDNYCGRSFATGTYVDQFMGSNTATYFTRDMPLNSISSITYQIINPYITDDASDSSTASGTFSSTDYYFTDKGCIKSLRVFLPNRLYTVTYNAGYQTANIPRPIKTATMMLAKHMADAIDVGNQGWPDGGALAQFKFGKFTEVYTAGNQRLTGQLDNLPPAIAILLKRYRYSKGV
jgi:hypothetical protein